MAEIELKPCPFCGNNDIVVDEIKPHTHSEWLKRLVPDLPDGKGECFIECGRCSCAICADTMENAIAQWNRRAGNSRY